MRSVPETCVAGRSQGTGFGINGALRGEAPGWWCSERMRQGARCREAGCGEAGLSLAVGEAHVATWASFPSCDTSVRGS